MIWKAKNNRLVSEIKLICCPILKALKNTPFGKKLWGPYTLATFSVISTKGNNYDILFALKQLAGQVVDASEFESPVGRVQLMIVWYFNS